MHQLPLIQSGLDSEDLCQKQGSLMCLAMLAEGCADHIRTKYVQLNRKRYLHVCVVSVLLLWSVV